MHFVVAYIDPGSGAMMLQWIIAAVLGGMFAFRKLIRRMLNPLLPRRFRSVPESPAPAEPPPEDPVEPGKNGP